MWGSTRDGSGRFPFSTCNLREFTSSMSPGTLEGVRDTRWREEEGGSEGCRGRRERVRDAGEGGREQGMQGKEEGRE